MSLYKFNIFVTGNLKDKIKHKIIWNEMASME